MAPYRSHSEGLFNSRNSFWKLGPGEVLYRITRAWTELGSPAGNGVCSRRIELGGAVHKATILETLIVGVFVMTGSAAYAQTYQTENLGGVDTPWILMSDINEDGLSAGIDENAFRRQVESGLRQLGIEVVTYVGGFAPHLYLRVGAYEWEGKGLVVVVDLELRDHVVRTSEVAALLTENNYARNSVPIRDVSSVAFDSHLAVMWNLSQIRYSDAATVGDAAEKADEALRKVMDVFRDDYLYANPRR